MPITLERIFLAGGRLRSAWRFLLSLPALVVAFAAAQVALEALPQGLKSRFLHDQIFPLGHVLLLLAFLGVFKILTNFLDRRPLGSMGLAFHPRWGRELGLGLILGAGMILAVAGLEEVLRLAHFGTNSLTPAQALSGAAFYGVTLAIAATNEELMFRGYPFQRLVEAITPAGGIAVTSVLFGVAHLGNAHHTWLSTLNTALVGVPFAIAYLRTRSLWLPVGIHFSWNFVLGFVFGLPVSGFAFPDSLLQAQVQGAAWVTGAAYGPEGGVLATCVVVGVTIYLMLSKRIYVSEEMRKLILGPDAATPSFAAAESPAPAAPSSEAGSRGPASEGPDRQA